MKWLAQFIASGSRVVWLTVVALALASGYMAGEMFRLSSEQERIDLLEIETERQGIEMMSQTLNGSIMGAIAMAGLTASDIKQEVDALAIGEHKRVVQMLESIGRAYAAEGVFTVGRNGAVLSSWDDSGKPSTGLDVKFRPYFQMAMQGKESVYAAVSLATGRRAMYFAAPVYAEAAKTSPVIGAVAIRIGLDRVDRVLKKGDDKSLLLSPQGVVFAASSNEWIGQIAGEVTPERLAAIRGLKQFGNVFASNDPQALGFSIEPGVVLLNGQRHAVEQVRVNWNDPNGDWLLVRMENLTRTVSQSRQMGVVAIAAAIVLLVLLLLIWAVRANWAKKQAATRLQEYVERQKLLAERKAELASISISLQQSGSVEILTSRFLQYANQLFGSLQGAVYLFAAGNSQVMQLAAGFGCVGGVPGQIEIGEGLLGQCVAERTPLFVDHPPEAYWRISSGLGETVPALLVLQPVLLNDQLLGAVELALLKVLEADERALLDELLTLLAINLGLVLHNQPAIAISLPES